MRNIVLCGIAACALSLGAVRAGAQSYTSYTQSEPVLCKPGSVTCYVPLSGGGGDHYYIACQQEAISTFCSGFFFDEADGRITEVVTYFPGLGSKGAFSFKFSLNDGRTGSVSGQAHWVRAGKSWQAEIDSSTLTVN